MASPFFNKLNPLRTPLEQALLWPLVLLRLPAEDTVSRFDLRRQKEQKKFTSSGFDNHIRTLLAYHKNPQQTGPSQGSPVICAGRKVKSKQIFKAELETGTSDSCNGFAKGPANHTKAWFQPSNTGLFLQLVIGAFNPLMTERLHR